MVNKINHEYVEYIPEKLEDNILYISLPFSVAIHNCCCGCGERTVTPFGLTEWKLESKENLVSLTPSIGNFQFKCKSHYWIKDSKIIWC